jgi:hypothetical protein
MDMAEIDETDARLQTHEAVCAIRYEGLCARLKRLENIGIGAAGSIIAMLITIIFKIG